MKDNETNSFPPAFGGFELPSNIRQIGTIGDGMRIYVEDYVSTYLKQYAESGGHCEKLAFLIGKNMTIDNLPYLFINGAVQGKYTEFDGVENFTEKSFSYAEEQIKLYFPGYEIVGWMQSQPGFGTALNQTHGDSHMNNFTKPGQVLFVTDPLERVSSFYVWKNDSAVLRELKGYFIYYDKNPGMQDYMLENKIIKLTLKEKPVLSALSEHKTKSAGGETPDGSEDSPNDIGELFTFTRKPSAPESRRETAAKAAGAERRARMNASVEYKRIVNMLVSLSAVLFVICFIMGAGLLQSDGRIGKLENSFATLDSAYSYLVSEASKTGTGTQSVFAQSADNIVPSDSAASTAGNILDEYSDKPLQAADSGSSADSSGSDLTAALNTEDNAVAQTAQTSPAETVPPAATAATGEYDNVPDSYEVEKGDNLYYISLKFYGTTNMVQAIMDLNKITDPDTIYYGKVLLLPH